MRIKWDETGKRFYEAGVKNGVLYPQENGAYPKGVAWNGLTEVSSNPEGAEETPLYADDAKYASIRSAEEYAGSISAYTYPDEFEPCNGVVEVKPGVTIGQQDRKPFGLCYRTGLGNDTDGIDYGYKLHLVYGATASPSEKTHSTINTDPDIEAMSWDFKTTPVAVNVEDLKPTSHLTINSTKLASDKLKKIEDILYGTEEKEARLPLPDEVFELIGSTATEVTEPTE